MKIGKYIFAFFQKETQKKDYTSYNKSVVNLKNSLEFWAKDSSLIKKINKSEYILIKMSVSLIVIINKNIKL